MHDAEPDAVADAVRASATAANSTTQDDASTNQQLNKIANDLGTQNTALIASLNAIATAINAKPSA